MIARLGDHRPELIGNGHYVAPNATVVGRVRLHAYSSVWFGAVLRGDKDWIVVGENSNIQDGAVLHTDPGIRLTLGRGVTVGHQAMLHGCTVGDNALIGIGSTLLNGSVIGSNSVVGAHALVTEGKEFPEGVLILGAPAKVVRDLTPDEIGSISASASSYVENARYFNHAFQDVTASDD